MHRIQYTSGSTYQIHKEEVYRGKKLPSLTIFFPFFNDAGTVETQLRDALVYGNMVAKKLEIFAIHGGASRDNTLQEIRRVVRKLKKGLRVQVLEKRTEHVKESERVWKNYDVRIEVKVIDVSDNKHGYAVIWHGLRAATSEWVFYTDGDRQYHVRDLVKLVKTQVVQRCDVVNGYKVVRGDSLIRTLPAKLYAVLNVKLLKLPIRDPHCDFRLIRTALLNDFHPIMSGAGIIDELLLHFVRKRALCVEISVPHYSREYGVSNYSLWQLMCECGQSLWHFLRRM